MLNDELHVGIVLTGVPDLTSGGGAERYFAELVQAAPERIRHSSGKALRLSLLADPATLVALAKIGRSPSPDRVEVLPASRLGQTSRLGTLARRGPYELLHLAQALPRHLGWLLAPHRAARQTSVSVNLNDVRAAYGRSTRFDATMLETYLRFGGLDGLMSWYSAFLERRRRHAAPLPPVARSARYCFVDTSRFQPDVRKSPCVVFCGRMVPEKRPELFVDTVAAALHAAPESAANVRFVMFGGGPLLESIRHRIAAAGLTNRIEIGRATELLPSLRKATVFVSTQDHENFTSLAMLEAMACGLAILSRNVGQTRLFVRHDENGLLVDDASPSVLTDKLAGSLVALLSDPPSVQKFGAASRTLVLQEHNVTNVLSEFADFWIAARRACEAARKRPQQAG